MSLRAVRAPVRRLVGLREQPAVERKLTIFHYEQAMAKGESAFAIDVLEKKTFGPASVMVVLLASVSGKHVVLYSVSRSEEASYRFRRLHPDAEGPAVRELFDAARSDDFRSLGALGLSYGELGAVTGRSRQELQRALRGA